MSAGCLRGLLGRAALGLGSAGSGGSGGSASGLLVSSEGCSWRWSSSSTAGSGETLLKKQQQRDPRGQRLHPVLPASLRVIGVAGENLGVMGHADARRLTRQGALKLVPVSTDPPVYKLLTGKRAHEEQMEQREKQKDKPRAVQVKELMLSADIGAHDLRTKLRQVQSWLEKRHHVRLTLRARPGATTQPLDTSLEQIVQQMEVEVGYDAKPAVIKAGQAAMCVIRPAKKEASQQGASSPPSAQTTASSSPQPASTSPDSPAGKTKDSSQQ